MPPAWWDKGEKWRRAKNPDTSFAADAVTCVVKDAQDSVVCQVPTSDASDPATVKLEKAWGDFIAAAPSMASLLAEFANMAPEDVIAASTQIRIRKVLKKAGWRVNPEHTWR